MIARSHLVLTAMALAMAGSPVVSTQPPHAPPDPARIIPSITQSNANAAAVLEGLPLAFEPAASGQARFVVHSGAAQADIRRDGLVVVDRSGGRGRVEIDFRGARAAGRLEPGDRLAGRVNYLRGAKREDWRIGVPRYGRVRGPEIYPGIDVDYYGTRQHLEYDFIVRPGADPRRIELTIKAGEEGEITADGELALRGGTVIQKKPVAFQAVDGTRRSVEASYIRRGDGAFGIRVGVYDPTLPLIIDPVVVYAFSWPAPGAVTDMVTDSAGALYLVGTAFWADLAGQGACSPDCTDGFVYKLNRNGDDLEFATFLVGSGDDFLGGIGLDATGNILVGGATKSSDFPGATQPGIVIARLASNGSEVLKTDVYPVDGFPASAIVSYEAVLDFAVSSSGLAYAWVKYSVPECTDVYLVQSKPSGAPTLYDFERSCVGFGSFAVALGADDHVYTSSSEFIRSFGGTMQYILPNVLATAIAITPDGGAVIGYSNQLRSISPTGGARFTVEIPPGPSEWPVSRIAHVAVDTTGTILAVRCGQWTTPTPGSTCAAFHYDQAGALLKWDVVDEPIDSVFTSDRRGMLYVAKDTFTIRKYSFATAVFVAPPAASTAGTPIALQAATSLPGPVEYAFWRHTTATGWVPAQSFSTSSTFNWTPGASDVGMHNLQVFVREAGSSHSYEAWGATQVQILAAPPPTVDAFSASTLTGIPGAPVTFTATASGGAAPLQYQFWRLQSGTWQIVQPYSASATFAWTPGIADVGTHTLQVWVRNAGSSAPFDAWRGMTFTVSTPPAPVIQSLVASPSAVAAGATVTFTATATGIAPMQYRFWRLDSDGWKLVQDYGPSATYSWTPGIADVGAHAVQVWVRTNGSTAAFDAWRSVDVSVIGPPPVTIASLTRSVASPAPGGSPITWTAMASGGSGSLHYQFWRLDAGGWTLAQAYGPSNTYTWTPGAGDTGDHVIQVWARPAGSVAPFEAWRGDLFSVQSP